MKASTGKVQIMGKLCTVDDCDGTIFARQMCSKHYGRWYRTGSTDVTRIFGDDLARFMSYVDKESVPGHWIWTGYVDPKDGKPDSGYPKFITEHETYAHRWSYSHFKLDGHPLPKGHGWHVDHLCRIKVCVNPDCLQYVPAQINVARNPNHIGKQRAARTHCKHGHDITMPENVYQRANRRYCKPCALRNAREQSRKRAEQRRSAA